MVSARQGNMKRKNGNNKGGNMRKNFKQGPQFQQQQQQHGFKQQLLQQRNVGRPNMSAMFNQNPMMDNPNQMMDNPGYMDFNEPPIVRPSYQQKGIGNKNQQQIVGNLGMNASGMSNGNGNANGKGNKNRGRRIGMKQQQQQQQRNGGNGQRIPNQRNGGNNVGNKNNAIGRWSGQQRNNQNGNFGMNRGQFGPMQPPMQMGRMHPGDFDYAPQQFFGPQRFAPGPGPMMPMMGPPIGRPMQMMGPPMGRLPLPIPPFRARNAGGRNGNAGGRNGPIRRKGNQQANNRRANPKAGKNKKKGERKGGKKPMTNAEKYPLDKPWVTDEIKAAHDKKVELSNQLKGKKDDELFAEFKKQRDAFVTQYEAARTEYNAKNKPEVII